MLSIPARMKKIQSKIKALEWPQRFSHYNYGDFSRHSMAANSKVHGRIWLKFELIPDFMIVLITCKNEEDPIKNEGASVAKTLYTDFSDAQGQLTP